MNEEPTFHIYNTLSDEKEPLEIPSGRPLQLFVCGPTVYDHPHIGNARTFVFFDSFVQFLRSQGIEVFFLMNITDIDDKIIARAKEERVSWKQISRQYEKLFMQNLKGLRVVSINAFARATSYIPEIVKQVETLIEKKHVYLIPDDGYYFDLSTYPPYGELARRTMEQAEDGISRIDDSDKKRNRGDFCVWKFSTKEEPGWKTKLGFGRPGWHIEDTAITEHYFGPQYDVHGGAMDLKFPHHEAERAQQESASGKAPFVKLWMHGGFLTVNGKRMGKSNHNFVTIEDLLAHHTAQTFRMALFMHHYRSPFDYTDAIMETAVKHVYDISLFTEKLIFASKKNSRGALYGIALAEYETMKQVFLSSLMDDFNSPKALGALFEYMSGVQKRIWDMPKKDAAVIASDIRLLFESVGISVASPKIPREIKDIVKQREGFKRSQQFVQSDALRDKAGQVGYVIEDTPKGPFIFPKR